MAFTMYWITLNGISNHSEVICCWYPSFHCIVFFLLESLLSPYSAYYDIVFNDASAIDRKHLINISVITTFVSALATRDEKYWWNIDYDTWCFSCWKQNLNCDIQEYRFSIDIIGLLLVIMSDLKHFFINFKSVLKPTITKF